MVGNSKVQSMMSSYENNISEQLNQRRITGYSSPRFQINTEDQFIQDRDGSAKRQNSNLMKENDSLSVISPDFAIGISSSSMHETKLASHDPINSLSLTGTSDKPTAKIGDDLIGNILFNAITKSSPMVEHEDELPKTCEDDDLKYMMWLSEQVESANREVVRNTDHASIAVDSEVSENSFNNTILNEKFDSLFGNIDIHSITKDNKKSLLENQNAVDNETPMLAVQSAVSKAILSRSANVQSEQIDFEGDLSLFNFDSSFTKTTTEDHFEMDLKMFQNSEKKSDSAFSSPQPILRHPRVMALKAEQIYKSPTPEWNPIAHILENSSTLNRNDMTDTASDNVLYPRFG